MYFTLEYYNIIRLEYHKNNSMQTNINLVSMSQNKFITPGIYTCGIHEVQTIYNQ